MLTNRAVIGTFTPHVVQRDPETRKRIRQHPNLPRALVLAWFNFKELQEMIDEEGLEEYEF